MGSPPHLLINLKSENKVSYLSGTLGLTFSVQGRRKDSREYKKKSMKDQYSNSSKVTIIGAPKVTTIWERILGMQKRKIRYKFGSIQR